MIMLLLLLPPHLQQQQVCQNCCTLGHTQACMHLEISA
jgi:hypothetical protein